MPPINEIRNLTGSSITIGTRTYQPAGSVPVVVHATTRTTVTVAGEEIPLQVISPIGEIKDVRRDAYLLAPRQGDIDPALLVVPEVSYPTPVGEIRDLPGRVRGTIYIVPREVAEAVPARRDLYFALDDGIGQVEWVSPDRAVRVVDYGGEVYAVGAVFAYWFDGGTYYGHHEVDLGADAPLHAMELRDTVSQVLAANRLRAA